MGREFELKYALTEECFEKLCREYVDFQKISMETVYYDTPEGTLGKRKWTLRRRLENGISVCTLKTPGERNGRGEWETECQDIGQAMELLCQAGAPEELRELTRAGIAPLCGAAFIRRAKLIELPGGVVELALDRGAVTGGGKEGPILELEVELKAGAEEVAMEFARELAQKWNLKEEPRSKFARARALLAENGGGGNV